MMRSVLVSTLCLILNTSYAQNIDFVLADPQPTLIDVHAGFLPVETLMDGVKDLWSW